METIIFLLFLIFYPLVFFNTCYNFGLPSEEKNKILGYALRIAVLIFMGVFAFIVGNIDNTIFFKKYIFFFIEFREDSKFGWNTLFNFLCNYTALEFFSILFALKMGSILEEKVDHSKLTQITNKLGVFQFTKSH